MPADTCRRHGYTLLEELPSSPGSRFLARVRDDAGRQFILKSGRDDLDAYRYEAATLRAWAGTGAAVQLADEPEPGLLVLPYIPGRSLAELPDHGTSRARDVGQLARRLHIPAPAQSRPLREHLQHDWEVLLAKNPLVDRTLKRIARDCMERLCYAQDVALLHGDLRPTNILLTAETQLVAIDPYGVVGPPAFDLAYMATLTTTPDRRALLRDLTDGYGTALPLLPEAFAWNCILTLAYYIRREKPFDGLHLLVSELLHSGDPASFLAGD